MKAALFAELPPGGKLNPHRDPYAGSVRFHLGLVTPNDDKCFINIDGTKYSWRDGECVLFDETFIHEAYNNTRETRIILFCDIERSMRFRIMTSINHFFSYIMMSKATSPNDNTDQVGTINKLYSLLIKLKVKLQRKL